jgi:NADH dehydrogenase
MADARPHVVVVGAGFAGLRAALKLAKLPVRVTVIDRENHHTFQPLLYQVASASLATVDIAVPIRSTLEKAKNVTVLLDEVTGIDPARKEVQLREGSLSYDYLVLAAGARHSYFGNDAWEPYAPGLKTIDDALDIRSRILLAFEAAERERALGLDPSPLNIVIVGAGPTGVELAGSLAEFARTVLAPDFRLIDTRRSRIILVEAAPRVLPTYPEDLSQSAERQLRDLGVEVRTNARVTNITPGLVSLHDSNIPAAVVLWAAGVKASELGVQLGVQTDRAGRVHVEQDLSVPGHPEIFVVGDLMLLNDPHTGKPYPGLAQVAIEAGNHAVRNIEHDLRHESREPFRFKLRGNMATIGKNAAVAEVGKAHFSGIIAWVAWLVIHLFWLIGFSNRLVVLIRWAWAYFANDRRARIITGLHPPKNAVAEQSARVRMSA